MSAKTEEAKERMSLKTKKFTPSLERRTRSARRSSNGALASFGGRDLGDWDMVDLINQSNGFVCVRMKENRESNKSEVNHKVVRVRGFL